MAAPLNVPLPIGLVLTGGYTLVFSALDATTGNEVANVKVSGATIQGDPAATEAKLPKPELTFVPGPPLA